MRRGVGALAALLLLPAVGCVTYERGQIDLAAAQPPPLYMKNVADRVEGRSCGQWVERQYEAAVDDALAKAAGANALIDAVYRFENLCIVVSGRAVRIGAP
jgi:hypothetical protein